MEPIAFTAKDIHTLRQAARYLRAMELQLPDTAHKNTHLGVLTSAMWLDHQADERAAAPQPPSRQTRRPIFNHLVAPEAGGPVFHVRVKAMLDEHEAAVRAETLAEVDERLAAMTLPEYLKGTFDAGSYGEAWRHCRNVVQELAAVAGGARSPAEEELLRVQGAMLALHPKTANPRHGCCASPKLCSGHRPECRSSEHQIGGKEPWPCQSLRAVGICSDENAQAVRQALAALERQADPHGHPSRKKTNRSRTVHATRQLDDGIGDIGACGMYFPTDTVSSLEDPGTEVSCQACVKVLARKELADAKLNAALAGPDGCSRNVIDGNVGDHFFKKGALSDSPVACIYCGTPKPDATDE
ncbi:hypothetical protein ABZ023_18630 [Streptomyces sp. NPDC006367]|uniref:hypothetical protein n=1 Tax=unclassified Streptomyces TaxID=2593676 RepID=UPI0033A2331C